MRAFWIIGLLIILFFSCKEKPKGTIPDSEKTIKDLPKNEGLSPVQKEILNFADSTFSGRVDMDALIAFKKIDAQGITTDIDMNEGILLYKELIKSNTVEVLPIFEVKNTNSAILSIKGKGFGGAIWAKVLVDIKTLEIKKIEFDHKSETYGYGSAVTQSTFENQFVGTKIDLDKNSFTLQQNMERRMDDGVYVDGISGATITSAAAIQMVNLGLKKYKGYLVHNR
ncbi:FMN-binding protein [Maribacter litopenaei]|uniref:FMN-binding protein n=1 Tax=Maribacter litopenaei TaxID=2976127 RepID=A0ABY5Y7Y9_9FLAO|nr:FMN-binding protein [Maribacter litopenaei]UWX54482.1 FMN-binding protein [Maribacter litopenaei]